MKNFTKSTTTKFTLIYFLFLALTALVTFLPGFNLFFHQDDFVHRSFSLSLGQVFDGFNLFSKAAYPYFRPVSTQTYWFILPHIFGMTPLSYHIFNFLILILNTILVFVLGKNLKLSLKAALLASLFYCLSATHIAPMFSSAYVQELFLVTFSTLALIFFCKKKLVACFLFFLLAVASKETALVLPGLFVLIQVFVLKGRDIKYLIPLGLFTLGYLFLRLTAYGIPESSSYHFMFGKSTLNILVWYFLWAVSVPNILIDFIGPGLKINPVLFKVTGTYLSNLIIGLPIFFGTLAILVVKVRPIKLIIFSALWFVIGVLPVVIFPLHHLAVEQTISLVGLSFLLGSLAAGSKRLGLILIVSFIFVSMTTAWLGAKTHWTATGARLAEKVVTHVKSLHPTNKTLIYFTDGKILIPAYGSSRQISLAVGGMRGFHLLFNPSLKVYYEADGPLPKNLTRSRGIIYIDSSKLLY